MSDGRFTIRGTLVERTSAPPDGPSVEVQKVGETDPRARWYVPADELRISSEVSWSAPHVEARVVINGVVLTDAQSMALRVAVTDFRLQLADPEHRDALGPIAAPYDARLAEIERLMVEGGR